MDLRVIIPIKGSQLRKYGGRQLPFKSDISNRTISNPNISNFKISISNFKISNLNFSDLVATDCCSVSIGKLEVARPYRHMHEKKGEELWMRLFFYSFPDLTMHARKESGHWHRFLVLQAQQSCQ